MHCNGIIFTLLLAIFCGAAFAEDSAITIFDAIKQYENVSHAPLEKNNTFIFISFSMPKQSIRQWAQAARDANIPVIVRGLINNSFKDTVKQLMEIDPTQTLSIQLDPNRFKQYHITQVPAVVHDTGDEFNVLYGDVSLPFALERLKQKG